MNERERYWDDKVAELCFEALDKKETAILRKAVWKYIIPPDAEDESAEGGKEK